MFVFCVLGLSACFHQGASTLKLLKGGNKLRSTGRRSALKVSFRRCLSQDLIIATYLPLFLDLYSDLEGQESSSDPKLCDTRPGTGKRAKVNHWQGKVGCIKRKIKIFSPRRSRQRERTSSAILRERHRPRYFFIET